VQRPPSVDELARKLAHHGLPHPLLVEVARSAIANRCVDDADDLVRSRTRRLLTPVINATGVLLHTNMGRAPLAHQGDAQYTNLELDLASGARGSRQAAIGELLATATGAEAAMVVNNCAGAVMLALAAVAGGHSVAVSRGELVEIGGAFRVPDVMALSGAELVEVGTTNRTRLGDYRKAVDQGAHAVLKVHQSNYRIVGFTEETSVRALSTVDVPVIADIGSGLLDSSCPWLDGPPPRWLEGEPAARQTLRDGADLVTFSGDKLFGGPQAGIIAGKAELVAACGRHPLARALRPGSLVLDALQTTTMAYLDRRGGDIEFWRMAATPVHELERRANDLAVRFGSTSVIDTHAVPGGGTLPTVSIPSRGVRINADQTSQLREFDPPVIARVDKGATIIDVLTINPDDDWVVGKAMESLGASIVGAQTNAKEGLS